ncbi:MAG: hypothetical protein M1380_08440 [Chloroflexi bacterium]|nr:hypothetical protein [Chloroflexota bacterium]
MSDRSRLIEVAFPLKQASLDSVHEVELTENQWGKTYNCATPHPWLLRLQDPFAKLLARVSSGS